MTSRIFASLCLFLALSSTAYADLTLDLGGFWRGYGVYADNDENGTAALSDDLRKFDLRRDTELYIEGETKLDNGLTLGFMHEQDFGGANQDDEIYLYFSGDFGRVNLGNEDGAAYLLQTAIPSADSNIDGKRVYIQALNTDGWNDNNFTDADFAGERLDYDNADFSDAERVTYFTPKWSGFQGGFSFAPEPGQNAVGNNIAGMATNDDAGGFDKLYEAAFNWKGALGDAKIDASAGYAFAKLEEATAAGLAGSDDRKTWNAGVNVTLSEFSFGGTWLQSNSGVEALAGEDADTRSFQVGAGWDRGAYHLGASWFNRKYEEGLAAIGTADLDVDRFTAGGTYSFGAGATFRGTVAMGEADADTLGLSKTDFTQVSFGTEVQF